MNLTKIKVQIEKGNKVQEEHGKVDATSKKKQFLRPRCEIAVKNMDLYLFLVGPQNSIGFQVNIYVGIYGVMSEIVFGKQWKFHLHGSLLKYFQLVLINFDTDCGDVSS